MTENPYAAPSAEVSPPTPAPVDEIYASPYGPYRSIDTLQKIMLGLLSIGALLALGQIYAIIKLNEANQLPDDDPSAEDRIDFAWTLSDQIEDADTLFAILTVIIWCFWKSRASKNAWVFTYRREGRKAILNNAVTPGLAVGSYFIPVLNFYKPYQAMSFIHRSLSANLGTSKLLILWWLTWLTGSNVGTLFLFAIGKISIIAEEELELDDLTLYNQSLILDSTSYLVSCLVAAAVIYHLSTCQKQMAREIGIEG